MERPRFHAHKFLEPGKKITTISSLNPVSVRSATPIDNIIKSMLMPHSSKRKRTSGFRRLPVTGKDGTLQGIVGITDLLGYLGGDERHSLFRESARPLNATVKRIMKEPEHMDSKETVSHLIGRFRDSRIGAYPITIKDKTKAIVSQWDVVNRMDPRERTRHTVEEVMMRKVITAKKNFMVKDVAKMLVRGGFRRLPVTDRGYIVGIITPHDILSHLYATQGLERLRFDKTPIKEVMTRSVASVRPEESIHSVITTIRRTGMGGFPVVDEGEVIGILTERDVIDFIY